MPTLTITRNNVLSVANLDNTVAANQTMADDVISQNEAMYEAWIKPEVLSTSSYLTFLTSWVTQLCAADVLDRMRRADGASSSLVGAGITVGKPDDLGALLRSEAMTALAGVLRMIGRPTTASTTTDTSPASQDSQGTLFGDSEAARLSASELGF